MGAMIPVGPTPLPGDVLVEGDVGVTVQPFDPFLNTLSAAPTGLLAKTSPSAVTSRSITGIANQINVANGDGIAGDPIIATPQDIHTGAAPTFAGLTTTGGIYRGVVSVGSGAHVVTASDHTILASATAANVEILLPSAGDGPRELRVKLIDASGGVVVFTPDGADTVEGSASLAVSGLFSAVVLQSDGASGWFAFAEKASGIPTVRSREDLPAAVAGGIPVSRAYFVEGIIELGGDWLDIQPGAAFEGLNGQTAGFMSTGLVGGAILRSTTTVVMRRLTFIGAAVALDLDGVSSPANVISWREIVFLNCLSMGTLDNYTTVVWKDSAMSSCGELAIDGAFRAILLQNMGWPTIPDGVTAVSIAATASFELRLAFDNVNMGLGTGSIGIDCDVGAAIPSEGYSIRDCSIDGPGTPLAGRDELDPASLFENNRGFENSAVVGSLFMEDNATITTIAGADTYTKAAGTTTAGSILARFTHSDNRLTHIGQIERIFLVTINISTEDAANDNVAVRVAVNGTPVNPRTSVSHNNAGDASPYSVTSVVSLGENDYIEAFIANLTDASDITAVDLSMTVTPA